MRDEWFVRGQVPMTKSEVRAVSISKLELTKQAVCYDIGAGTGSVAVEAAMSVPEGQIYAIEKEDEALELIGINKERFQVNNLTVVKGTAPEVMEDLPVPTHAFVGGSCGRLEEIVDGLLLKNPGVRMVFNAIALETVGEVLRVLKMRGLSHEVVSVQVSKALQAGKYHMMQGQNPIYVISAGGEACIFQESF